MKVWIVTAHRWGMEDTHNYVVGAYGAQETAIEISRLEESFRGGKYSCEITCTDTDSKWRPSGELLEEITHRRQTHHAFDEREWSKKVMFKKAVYDICCVFKRMW